MDSPRLQSPPTTSQAMLTRREAAQDWEARKATITELYSSKKLWHVMKIMSEEHGFNATVNQYKKQFGAWGLKKYTKSKEDEALISKRRKRKCEDPVREDDVETDIATSSDLSYCTPPPSFTSTPPTDIEIPTTRIRTPKPVIQSPLSLVHTPLVAVPSPHLSSFKWFNAYCDDESKRAGGILKFEGSPIKNLVGTFVKAIDSYEDRFMYEKMLKVHSAGVDCLACKFRNALDWVDNISEDQQKTREIEFLLGILFESLLLHMSDDNYIVPSKLEAIAIDAAVEIAIRGLTLYLKIGKVEEATHVIDYIVSRNKKTRF